MAKPVLSRIWSAFPDHEAYPTLRDLYTHLGGGAARNIQVPGFGSNGNTCASRLSMAFNGGGAPIIQAVAQSVGAETLGAGDGSRIIFRVTEFRKYPIRVLGKPSIDNTSPYDSAFRGKRGIVAFTVNWGDASGHIALWNGAHYREPGHDNYATYANGNVRASRGEFWELA